MTTERARRLRRDSTDVERRLWAALGGRRFSGYKFRRQVPLEGFIADFVCHSARLIVELDGGQHAVQAENDARRSAILESAGYRIIRFWNNEMIENPESVLDRILLELQAQNPSPGATRRPLPQGER